MSERSVNKIKAPTAIHQRAGRRGGSTTKFKQAVISTIAPPLEWYRLTENSRNVLNAVIVTSAKEEIKETSKPHPDKRRIDYLKSLYIEAYDAARKSSNFESLEKMKEIVKHYQAILRSLSLA